LIAFLAFGVAIWSQLTIGWQWSAPAAPATKAAMLVMSAVVFVFAGLALLAAIPLGCTLCRAFVQGRASGLLAPVISVVLGTVVLVVGSIHFGHGWPGTGGHPWAGRDVVPGAVARFCWAATLWITSYWAHPGALASFLPSEIAWMVASPIALLAVLIGAAKTLRRLPLSPRVLRYEAWLGTATALAMAGFLAGASSWIISGGPAPRGLFRVGAIDSVGVAVMAAALILAFRAAQRALAASLIRPSTN
jgi:ABC-type Co2+ transport system permease subunit